MVIGWIVIGLLLLTSAFLLSGKGSMLVAGYNTSSKEQQARYDKNKLSRAAGAMLLLVMMALGFLLYFHSMIITILFSLFVIAAIITTAFYMNKKCKKPVPEDGNFHLNDDGSNTGKKKRRNCFYRKWCLSITYDANVL